MSISPGRYEATAPITVGRGEGAMGEHRTRGRARIGVVVPFSNTHLEPDMAMLCPAGVSVHFARAGGYDLDAIPDEHQMRRYSDAPFEEAVDSLLGCRPDIVLYGCTSARAIHRCAIWSAHPRAG